MQTSDDNYIPLVFNDYEELTKRPNFRVEIDTSKHKIDRIISSSKFKEMHPCGKSNCHQPYNNGWLVVTTDNLETLVGSVCGQEWGGDNFLLQKASFERRIKREAQLKAIYVFLQDSDKILDRVNEIKAKKHGANWLSKSITKLQTECETEMFIALKRRAANGATEVVIDVLKNKRERELSLASNGGAKSSAYKSESIGHFVGLEVFNSDLREVLIEGIYNKVIALKQTDPSTLSSPALNSLAQDLGEIDNLFTQAEDILGYGLKFFSTANNFKLIKTLDKNNRHNHLTKIDWFAFN